MNSLAFQLVTTLAALALVLALAWLSLRVMRNRLPGGVSSRSVDDAALRFVRALPLGPRERVVVVEHRGEQLMLGVTAGGISVLGRWPLSAATPAEVAAPAER